MPSCEFLESKTWTAESASALKSARSARGLTQKQMGQATGIGRARYSFIEWPRNPRSPSPDEREAIRRALEDTPAAHTRGGARGNIKPSPAPAPRQRHDLIPSTRIDRKPNLSRVGAILEDVRELAIQYYEETGKPLGITGEIAEFEAARLLGLELCEARQAGFDAVRARGTGPKRVQIKGRRILAASKPGQRVGSIILEQEWDSVVLVLIDAEFKPTVIYEAERPAIERALREPGSRARNERGALSVSKFKSIGKRIWPEPE